MESSFDMSVEIKSDPRDQQEYTSGSSCKQHTKPKLLNLKDKRRKIENLSPK